MASNDGDKEGGYNDYTDEVPSSGDSNAIVDQFLRVSGATGGIGSGIGGKDDGLGSVGSGSIGLGSPYPCYGHEGRKHGCRHGRHG